MFMKMARSILLLRAVLLTGCCLSIVAAAQAAAPTMTIYDKTTGIPDEVMFRGFLSAVATPPDENIDDHKSSIREVRRRMELKSVDDAETILAIFNSMNDEFNAEKTAFMRREVCPLDSPRPAGTEVLDRLAANDAFNDILGARFLARIQSQVAQPQYLALLSWMADLKQGTMIGRTNWHVVYADRDPDLLRQEICGRFDSYNQAVKSQ